MKEKITCSICQENYTQPKVLPCFHYFCKQCILKIALILGKDKPFLCPKGCKEATLPGGNEDNFQTTFFVNHWKALYDKQERALSKEVVMCEICTTSELKAEAFCRQCDMFICIERVNVHPRMKKIFNGHEIISLKEIKKVPAKEVFTKCPPTKKCKVHTFSLDIFCFDCNHLICRDCTITEHRDHDFLSSTMWPL